MSGEQSILREYLISLGFKVDTAAKQRFGEDLTRWDKAATRLGKSMVGVALGAAAMATEFAFRMERVYYASKLAESSAGNLQALDFAGKQNGIKDFAGNVQNLARALRANPGLQGMLNSLGVRVEGRDKSDVLIDIVKATRSMPHFIGSQFAAMFGMDPDDYLLMKQNLEGIVAEQERFKQNAADLGIDTEKAAQAGLEFSRQWRDVLTTVGLFRDAVSLAMLGPMKELSSVTQDVLRDWIRIVQVQQTAGKVTPESARQSGLSLEQQQALAARPEVKAGAEANRKRDDEGGSLFWKSVDWIDDAVTNAMSKIGLAPANPYGGAELSSSAKERLGEDRLSSSNQKGNLGFFGRMGEWARNAIGYRSRPREALDPQAIEVTTAPTVRAPEPGAAPATAQQRTQAPGAAQAPVTPDVIVGPMDAPSAPVLTAPPVTDTKHPEQQKELRALERQRDLPSGLLDYIWNKESGRSTRGDVQGPPTKTGERAQGPFQFMSGTATKYGLSDPQNFSDSAKAASSYLSDLMKKYGDVRFAAAAYNWGEGNLNKLVGSTMAKHGDWSQGRVDDYVLGHLPPETRKYIAGLGMDGEGQQQQAGAEININADTKIDVQGVHDPEEVARRVADNQHALWSNVAREFSAKVR